MQYKSAAELPNEPHVSFGSRQHVGRLVAASRLTEIHQLPYGMVIENLPPRSRQEALPHSGVCLVDSLIWDCAAGVRALLSSTEGKSRTKTMKIARTMALGVTILAIMALAIVCSATPAAAQSTSPDITLRPPASPAASGSPEALQAAKDLVGLISGSMLSDLSAKMTAQVWPAVETGLRSKNPKIDAATIAELRKEFERLQFDYISQIMSETPTIYTRYFTVQEMHDIVAFYQTPTGAKALKVMPQATADLLAMMTPRLQGMQEKVNLAFLNILQKRGLYAQ
jgi:uncharacterized protein